jgi:hypothetical protein
VSAVCDAGPGKANDVAASAAGSSNWVRVTVRRVSLARVRIVIPPGKCAP